MYRSLVCRQDSCVDRPHRWCVDECVFLSVALIDMYTFDFPISLGKSRAVLLHKLFAGGDPGSLRAALFLTRDTRRRPHRARPVTAQGGVKDRRLVLEDLERVASILGPERAGRPPICGNRRRRGDIGRDVLPGEEPDGDTRVVPKHCVDTTTVVVERSSERVGLTRPHTTPFITRLGRRTVRATDKGPRNTEHSDIVGQGAARVRV